MGGAAGYDKLWRRLGSSACIFLPMVLCHNPLSYMHLIALGMVLWGSWSYFGWLTPGNDEEQWFNFLVAALITQFAFVVLYPSWGRVIIAGLFAFAGTFGKVGIDNTPIPRRDIISELYYGFAMSLGTVISSTLS
jgi:hypothetical protein